MKALRFALGLLVLSVVTVTCHGGTLVQFHMYLGVNTYVGDIDVELYDQDKPITVQNFLKYVNGGYYGNSFFHRCIPGAILQGGGAVTSTPTSTNFFQSWNYIPPVFGQITNEFFSGTRRSNTYGTIAMARTTNFNSATSQFFFNLVDNSSQYDNPSNYYAVFGHVLRGTNILNYFNTIHKNGSGIIDMTSIYGVTPDTLFVTDLPVDFIGFAAPRFEDLVYMIVTTVNLHALKLPDNTTQISWNSVNGLTNNIEFATNLPPNWQVLTNVVGNGGTLTAIDTNTISAKRFYRVHVLY